MITAGASYAQSARHELQVAAGRRRQFVAANLLHRFRQHADAVLRSDPAAPFNKSIGERAVRMPKVKQKISGCFRTLSGAEHFCVIHSCLDTLRKQEHGMLTVLQRAFDGNPIALIAYLLNSHEMPSVKGPS